MTFASSLDGAWIAVQVRNNCERSVAAFLERVGYEQFLPLSRIGRTSQTTRAERPLFPGYVFCRYAVDNRWRIVQTPGVIRIVGHKLGPLPIDTRELEAIQRVVALGMYSEPWRFMSIGSRVRIHTGPLRGLEGLLLAVKAGYRLLLSISLLQRAVTVAIDARHTEPIDRAAIPGAPIPGGPLSAATATASALTELRLCHEEV